MITAQFSSLHHGTLMVRYLIIIDTPSVATFVFVRDIDGESLALVWFNSIVSPHQCADSLL